jgi:hypothetical protein
MGIDRWKQEHRNWRPSGVRLIVPETQLDESTAPSLVPNDKASSAKPRAAKKTASASSGRAASAADKATPKRSKR